MSKIINNSQIKVIEEIFKNPGISLRGVIEKTRLSPNYVLDYVNLLIRKGILKEKTFEKKRVYLRSLSINFNSSLARNLFQLVKEEEKELFYKRYPKLKPFFEQLKDIKRIEFILVYGSYARFAAEKDSDIDILIAGKIKEKEKVRETLVNLDIESSIKIESLKDFKKRLNDDIHQQMLKENILVYDSGKFINLFFK